jgi:uncharacterized protein (DUF58 family)
MSGGLARPAAIAGMASGAAGEVGRPAVQGAEHDPERDPERLLARLEWTVLRRLDGLLQGDYASLWRGAGLDFADLREYQPGDDVRHIDWNVSARSDRPQVRQFIEDRDVAAWLLVDCSASLGERRGTGAQGESRPRSRADLARQVLAVLASLFVRGGNPVGALFYRPGAGPGGGPLLLPWRPRGGRGQVLQLLAAFERVMRAPVVTASRPTARRPWWRWGGGRRAEAASAPAGRPSLTRLAELLEAAEGLVRRRSVLILMSDFYSEPGWLAGLGRLARRHELLALRLADPLDEALPPAGLLALQDAETGEQLLVDVDDAGFRARHAAAVQAREQELAEAFGRAGVDALELATDEDLAEALGRYIGLRRQRRRLRVRAPGRSLAASATAAAAMPPATGARP